MRWSHESSPARRRPPPRTGWRGRVAPLLAAAAALSGAALAGCQPPPEEPLVYLRLPALEAVHPAQTELRLIEEALAEAAGEAAPPPSPGVTPPLIALPAPEVPPDPPPPDVRRLEAEALERWRAGVPDPAPILRHDAAGQVTAEWNALQRDIRLARELTLADHLRDYVSAAEAIAREIGPLRARVLTVRPNPARDGLFYTPAQQRRRLLLYAQIQQELQELEDQRRAELRALLDRQEQERSQEYIGSREEIVRRWQQRVEEQIAAAEQRIAEEEARVLGRLPVPRPPEPLPPGRSLHTGVVERDRLLAAADRSRDAEARERSAYRRALTGALEDLQEEAARLRERIRSETAAAAHALARQEGLRARLGEDDPPRGMRDLTERFLPRVEAYLAGWPGVADS